MRTNFTIPSTPMTTVIWYRDGKKNKTLIDTPSNNEMLVHTMLMKHRVGFSEIRALQSVDTKELLGGFRRNF